MSSLIPAYGVSATVSTGRTGSTPGSASSVPATSATDEHLRDRRSTRGARARYTAPAANSSGYAGAEVVGLARADEEEDERGGVRPAERPEPAEPVVAEQRPEPGDPHERADRVVQQQLAGDEQRLLLAAGARVHVAAELEERPVVLQLEPEERQRAEHRDPERRRGTSRDRRWRRAGVSSSPSASAPSHTTIVGFDEQPERRRPCRRRSTSARRRCAAPGPGSTVTATQASRSKLGVWNQWLIARNAGVERDADRGHDLRGPAAAELPGDQRGEHDGRRAEQRRDDPQPGERRADDEVDGPGDPRARAAGGRRTRRRAGGRRRGNRTRRGASRSW